MCMCILNACIYVCMYVYMRIQRVASHFYALQGHRGGEMCACAFILFMCMGWIRSSAHKLVHVHVHVGWRYVVNA
jgi:hypothetical protein